MPLHSTRGTPVPWRMSTRIRWPPAATYVSVISVLEDVRTRRRREWRKAVATKCLRRIDFWTAAFGEPVHVVRPPRVFDRFGCGGPVVGGDVVDGSGAEGRLGVARRVDQCGDVSARGQHVGVVLASQQLRAAIGRLPWADVVGETADHVCVRGDLAQVDWAAEHTDRTWRG